MEKLLTKVDLEEYKELRKHIEVRCPECATILLLHSLEVCHKCGWVKLFEPEKI